MNRKIAALALAAGALLLAGACSGSNSDSSSSAPSESTVPDAPTTTYAPQDLELVTVPVAKPAPGVKVETSALPEDLQQFGGLGEITPDQQNCVNAAMKQAIDADPSLAKTPGKRASLTSTAMTVCDASAAFTDPIVEQATSGAMNPALKATPEQAACLKKAFADDKANTAKLIGSSLVMSAAGTGDIEPFRKALIPFDSKCGFKLSEAFTPPPS